MKLSNPRLQKLYEKLSNNVAVKIPADENVEGVTSTELMDFTPQQMKDFCANKTVGYLKGLENFLTIQFNNLSGNIRPSLLDIVKDVTALESKKEEARKMLDDVYIHMQRIENNIFVIRDCANELKVQ